MMKYNAFYHHLSEAIAINTERKKLYAKMTGNKSLWVSRPLILLEKASMLVALFIDRKAEKFQKMGIPIIANDFVPMHPLPSYDRPPLNRGKADASTLKKMALEVKNYRKSIGANIERGDFLETAHLSYEILQQIRKTEIDHQCHFAMTRHLIESIGFAALHAPIYQKASDGETTSLSKTFLRIQAMGLGGGLWLDKQAQSIHQMGVGIIINDIPVIPFEEEFKIYHQPL